MHIGNSQTQTYEYNTTQRAKYDNAYSSFVVDTKSVKENATMLTKDLIKFIDKSLVRLYRAVNRRVASRLHLLR